MSVSYDAGQASATLNAAASPVDWSMTVGASTDLGIIGAGLTFLATATLTATWDQGGANQSTTSAGISTQTAMEGSLPGYAQGFYRISPTTGTITLRVAWSTSLAYGCCGGSSYIRGTTAAGPTGTASEEHTNGSAPSLSVTCTSGNIVHDIVAADSIQPLTAVQTQSWKGRGAGGQTGASEYTTGNTQSWTQSQVGGPHHAHIAFEILQASAGRTALNTRSNPLGVNVGMGWRMQS